MIKLLQFLLLLMLAAFARGQEQKKAAAVYTLYLVGDAGEPYIVDQPLGSVLRQHVEESSGAASVIYLGDNIYPKGMPDQSDRRRPSAEMILLTQADWIKGLDAKGIFVPGNHDWQRGKRKGFAYIKNQQEWLDSLHDKNIMLLPRDGCAGPVEIPLTDKSVLVILDTQWFLHRSDKPSEGSVCQAKSAAEVWILLRDILDRNAEKRVILAGHHPLVTYGEHGGVFQLKEHIFPLTALNSALYIPIPVLGSIYPLYRKWFGAVQDVAHPSYKKMSAPFQKILAEHPGSIYAAGHEHALQYLIKDSSHLIVSGSGSKVSFVKRKKFSRYADAVNGFVKIKLQEDGAAEIEFWQADKKFPEGRKVHSDYLPTPGRLNNKNNSKPGG